MFFNSKLVIVILVLTQVHQISGAPEAVAHSRPYMVIVEMLTQEGETRHCAGFLLNEDFVMTAASCQAKNYVVFLGVHDVREHNEIQRVSVEEAFPHKDYDANTLRNDIMLLKLSSKVKFNQNVKPIALAGQSDGFLPHSCLISGWGSTLNSKYMSHKLREVNVTLIENEQCDAENFYCSEGETGPGQGDAGGPLVCEGKAYGVMSFIFKPKSGGQKIHGYTKIPDQRSWIDSTMTALKEYCTFSEYHWRHDN